MPISPIDFFSIPPRSQDVAHHQAGQNDRAASANETINVNYQQQVEHNSRQTVQKNNAADNDQYRYDAKEKGNESYKGKGGKKKKKEEEQKKGEKPIQTSKFDIRF